MEGTRETKSKGKESPVGEGDANDGIHIVEHEASFWIKWRREVSNTSYGLVNRYRKLPTTKSTIAMKRSSMDKVELSEVDFTDSGWSYA